MNTLRKKELGPFITNNFGDRFLGPVNRSSFSQVGYELSLRESFGSPPFMEGKLYVVVGTDSGLLVRYLLKFGLPARTCMLLVEFPEVLARIDEELATTDLGGKVAVVTFKQIGAHLNKLRFAEYTGLDQVVLIKAFCTMDAHLPEYVDLHEAVRQKLSSLQWVVKGRLRKQGVMKKRLENLGENRVSATFLDGLFQGKTAIVLGGGPSLDAVLPWLAQKRQNLVVLAVARISGRLRSVGITPDFIMTTDPNPESFDNSRETLTFWREAVLIHSEFASPPLIGQWRGRSLYFGARFDWETPLNGEAVPEFAPTVTNFAAGIGVRMGFRRILLAGVDFCFSKAGYTHGQGILEHSRGATVGSNLTVETNDGGTAESKKDFIVARDEMGKLAALAIRVGCKIINLAPGAAKIAGVVHLPPAQIDFRPQEVNTVAGIMGTVPDEDGETRIAHYQAMLAELHRAKECLGRINTLFDSAAVWKAEYRLKSIEKSLNEEQMHFYNAARNFGWGSFMRANATVDLENMTENEFNRVSLFFSAFVDGAGGLLSEIEAAEKRLHVRLEEERECPDFEALGSQWRADMQLGRILVWADRFPAQSKQLSEQIRTGIQIMKDEFEALLSGTNSLGAPVGKKILQDQEVRSIIHGFFKKKDPDGLERIGKSLGGYDNRNREVFMALARGHVAELAGREEQAFVEYGKIVDSGESPVLEDALSRIATLAG